MTAITPCFVQLVYEAALKSFWRKNALRKFLRQSAVKENFLEPLLAELKKGENARYINWSKVDDFRKFGGIRIEDDLVVTESGHKNLTRAAFAEA